MLFRFALPAGLTLALVSAVAMAADEGDPSAKLGLINQQIDKSASRSKALRDELQSLRLEEENISSRLIDLAANIQGREAMISAGERRLVALAERQVMLRAHLAEKRVALTELLAGLQRLERNRPPPLATRPDDAVSAIRGAMLFGAVVPAVNRETAALTRTLAELETLKARRLAEQEEVRRHLAKLDMAHKEMADLQKRKASLIEQTGQDLVVEQRRAKQLAGKARSVKQLMRAIAEERKRKTQEAAELAARQAEEQSRREFLSGRKFTKVRGKVDFPAQGHLVRRFGEKDSAGNASKGIYIATRSDGQVTAPVNGKIEFAGEFRSYGKLLILDVGEGYHVLLAGLEQLDAQTGQYIKAGEPIGRMGNASARRTLIGQAMEQDKPILYVEFRSKGRAVDSSSWWIGNRKEARR